MKNYTNEELLAIAQKEVARRDNQKEYDRQWNAKKKWADAQYKAFALANGFVLPEYKA